MSYITGPSSRAPPSRVTTSLSLGQRSMILTVNDLLGIAGGLQVRRELVIVVAFLTVVGFDLYSVRQLALLSKYACSALINVEYDEWPWKSKEATSLPDSWFPVQEPNVWRVPSTSR